MLSTINTTHNINTFVQIKEEIKIIENKENKWLKVYFTKLFRGILNIPNELTQMMINYINISPYIYLNVNDNHKWYDGYRDAYYETIINADCGFRSYCEHCEYMEILDAKYGNTIGHKQLFQIMNAEEMELFHDNYYDIGGHEIVKIDLSLLPELPDNMSIYINIKYNEKLGYTPVPKPTYKLLSNSKSDNIEFYDHQYQCCLATLCL